MTGIDVVSQVVDYCALYISDFMVQVNSNSCLKGYSGKIMTKILK
jgi:hypothetical protein